MSNFVPQEITTLIAAIEDHIEVSIAPSNRTVNASIINVQEIERLSVAADTLIDINTAIINLGGRISARIDAVKRAREEELAALNTLIGRLKGEIPPADDKSTDVEKPVDTMDDENTWTRVVRKPRVKATKTDRHGRRQRGIITAESIRSVIRSDSDQNEESPRAMGVPMNVNFTAALAVSAIRVPTFDYVRQDGSLYWVENCEHFAFCLSGQLFHGNIGTIYTEEKSPIKIKDCKFAEQCVKGHRCDYYHDPLKFEGSTDYRNFIAGSWLYSTQIRDRSRSRRFGSRINLDTDITNMHDEDISRFRDQTMHDILCSLLLTQYNQEMNR